MATTLHRLAGPVLTAALIACAVSWLGWHWLGNTETGSKPAGAGPASPTSALRNPSAASDPPEPESIDGSTPEQVAVLLLKRCHGPLMGAVRMANCVIRLGRTADDPDPELILLGSDRCMRVHRRDGTRQVQIRDHAWLLSPAAGGEFEIATIEGDERSELDRFQRLLRATLLEPLYQRAEITRQGPTVFAIRNEAGETWRLELRRIEQKDGASLWFPHSLSGPPGKVTFETLQHIEVTNLPKQVQLGPVGRRWFALEDSGMVFLPSVFTNPGLNLEAPKTLVKVEAYSPDPPVGKCELRTVAAKNVLVTKDPGDWEARFAVLLENGKTLALEQGQQAADLDFLFDEGAVRYLAQPFEMGDPDHPQIRGRPFVKRPGQRVLHLPAHEVVLVYPKPGTLESCEARARKLLDAFVAEKNLVADGPLRIIPWIELEQGKLSPREQRHLRVGFELPVRRR